MARRMLLAEVSGGRVRGRQRLGWMDGVTVAFGNRNNGGGCVSMRERVESLGTYVAEWFSHGYFCLALCSFGPPSRAQVGITWRELPFHDAVRINCKNGATTENQGAEVKNMG